jgi:hypothetical protein
VPELNASNAFPLLREAGKIPQTTKATARWPLFSMQAFSAAVAKRRR